MTISMAEPLKGSNKVFFLSINLFIYLIKYKKKRDIKWKETVFSSTLNFRYLKFKCKKTPSLVNLEMINELDN